MQMLRTLGTLWVVTLMGAVCAFAFLTLTDPFASRFFDGLLGTMAFALGAAGGYLLTRLPERVRTQSRRESLNV